MTDLLESAQRQWDRERQEHELTAAKLSAIEKDYDAALIELDQVQATADSLAAERDILLRRNAALEAQLKQIATACDGSIHLLAQLGRDALTAAVTPAPDVAPPTRRPVSAIVEEAIEMPMFLRAAHHTPLPEVSLA